MEKNDSQDIMWWIEVAAKAIIPLLVLVINVLLFTLLFLGKFVGNVNDAGGFTESFFGFSLPMIISLFIIPLLYERLVKRKNMYQMGLVYKPTIINNLLIVINIIIFIFSVLLLFYVGVGEEITIIVSFLIVAFSEEFMMRGVMINTLNEKLNVVYSVLISSFLFAFLYHSGDSDYINFIWRFPLGIIFALFRVKTESIYVSVLMHLWINILINIITII